jgi:hypothetical protein
LKTMKDPALIARFLNVNEIRMGSPYNRADLEIAGGTPSFLLGRGYQDLSLPLPDENSLILVEWDIEKNSPAFRLIRLQRDPSSGRMSASRTRRLEGAVRELKHDPQSGAILVLVYRYPSVVTEAIDPEAFSEQLA